MRVRIAGAWVPELAGKLEKGWRKADLDQLERDALELKVAHDSGRRLIQHDPCPRMGEWGDRWLDRIEAAVLTGDYSPNTLTTYRDTWKRIKPEIGRLRLNEIDTETITDLRVALSRRYKAATSVQNALALVSGMLSDAVPKHITHNPVSAANTRRARGRMPRKDAAEKRVMELDFARMLLANTRDADRPQDRLLHDMMLMALTSGMRAAELIGVKVPQVRLQEARIRIDNQRARMPGRGWIDKLPKYDRVRDAVLIPELADRLAARIEHLDDDDYVFISARTGRPYSHQGQRKLLVDAWPGRHDKDGWHVFRHTFASVLDRHRIRPLVIDVLMGHANPGVAARYRHVWDDEFALVRDVLRSEFGTPVVPVSAEVAAATPRA